MFARAQVPGRDFRRYRFTFLRHNEERAVAAFELFLASQEGAGQLASELLGRSDAQFVEVWSDGQVIFRFDKMPQGKAAQIADAKRDQKSGFAATGIGFARPVAGSTVDSAQA